MVSEGKGGGFLDMWMYFRGWGEVFEGGGEGFRLFSE